MKKTITLLGLLSGLIISNYSFAIEPREIQLIIDPLEIPILPSENQGTSALILDDGTSEQTIGDSGQFIWLNRFTPAAADFPFQLEEVSTIFGSTSVNIGDAIEILVYEDTDGDGDPGTGAILVASYTDTIQNNDNLTFNVYNLATPAVLNGPGDVIIGVVNSYGSEGFGDFPAALDSTSSAQRSWAATYTVGDVPANPTLPADEQWGTIDSFGFPGNWIIRGAGSPLFTIGGQVNGLAVGSSLELQNNGGDNLIVTGDGPYAFTTAQPDASSYDVTVFTQPDGQICEVVNATDVVSGADVSNIDITCATAIPQTVPSLRFWSIFVLMGLLMMLAVSYKKKLN